MHKMVSGVFLFVMCVAVYTKPAHAYLDPGTGSMLLQGLIGGVAAAGAAGSLYYHRIKGWFAQRFFKKPKDDASKGPGAH